MASVPQQRRAVAAVGERGVSVAGDVTGSVIVTGDNNDIKLLLGSEHGALIERLARSERPSKQLRRVPLRNLPGPPADSVDREQEAHAIANSGVGPGHAVNIHGDAGVGKTYALLRAVSDPESAIAVDAVYVYAAGGLDDVLQAVFDAFYEQIPPSKASLAQLRNDLSAVSAPVILDQLELERDAAQQLQLTLANCRIVVLSRERVIWGNGSSLPIHGLEPEFAIALIESEVGRRLEADERQSALQICEGLSGHPLRIREAVAPAREGSPALREIADLVAGAHAREALAAARLASADRERRRLLATLALFGEDAVGREHLKALLDIPDADAVIDTALADRDLRARSPRYSLGLTAADAVGSVDLTAAGDRALTHFLRWAHATDEQPQAQLIEGRAVLALLRWAVGNGRLRGAIELGRAIDTAFAVGRRFDGWRELLELVRAAARESGDRAAEAWALHQLGTRALALGELPAGSALLHQALTMRRELGDRVGASVTERNLGVAGRLARSRRARWRNPFMLLLVGALIAAGAVVAVTAGHGALPKHGGAAHQQHQQQHHAIVTVTAPSSQRTVVEDPVALQITATDSAKRTLTYTATGLPPGLVINRVTGLITGRPSSTGSYEVIVGAGGPGGANRTAHFNWIVTPAVARTVSVTNPGPQSNPVTSSVSVQIKAIDSAGAALTYSATGLPPRLTINTSSGLISGTLTAPSTSSVTVTVKDSSGASDTATFRWTITAQPVNVVTVDDPGDQTTSFGSRATVQIVAQDSAQATLTYAAGGLPPGLAIDARTGLISGVPSSTGSYPVTVTAMDSTGASDPTSFDWTITPPGSTTGPGTTPVPGTTTGAGTTPAIH